MQNICEPKIVMILKFEIVIILILIIIIVIFK